MTGPLHILDDELGEHFPDVPDAGTLALLSDEEVARLAVIAASAISEECICASWTTDAAEVAYRFSLEAGPVRSGIGTVTADECAALARLRERLAPMWVGRDGDDFYIVPAVAVVAGAA